MKDDRIFVRDGRRHHRRSYARGEAGAGLGVLLVLGAIAGWVAWKGGRPEPGLFEASPGDAPAAAADRGPLPADLAPPGWSEGPPGSFDAENLYVKIDGRADFYISFGFERLWFVTLSDSARPARTIDVELFDLGKPENALGAWSAERSPETEPAFAANGVWHLDRNAAFLAQGRFYARIIGSDESEATKAALDHLRQALGRGLPPDELPWAFGLFVGRLGLAPGSVAYRAENAFSFGFARDVHSARLADGETEVFVVRSGSSGKATRLAARFVEGFLGYGESAGSAGGAAWVKDRYLGSFATAVARGPWTAGVRGAPSLQVGLPALERLLAALDGLPAQAGTSAAPARTAPVPGYAAGTAPPEAGGADGASKR